MKFTYCPHCGSKLIKKEIGDEGLIPYCVDCKIPLWDMFTTCIICAVVNEYQEVALLRQSYASATHPVCVAGVMKLNESAEDCAVREVLEELGLQATEISFVRTYPFEKKEMLMIGFMVRTQKADLVLSGEVEDAQWVPIIEALTQLKPDSIAQKLVQEVYERLQSASK